MQLRARALLGALLGLAAAAADAQTGDYPSKPITLVVTFPAGGSSDALARPLAQRLQQALGQPVVIENRGGAGGTIGAAHVAKAAPDGHTLMITSSHHFIAEHVYKKLPYSYTQAFSPISVIASVPSVLVVNTKSSAGSLKDLLTQAKAQPGKLNYGSAGVGSTQHATAELFKFRSATQVEHVPYKGGGPMMVDLIAGQVDMAFETIPSAMTQIRGGKVKAIAVTTAKRSFALPDTPTMAEAGMPGFDAPVWYGVVGPAGMPRALVNKLNTTINGLLDSAEFKAQLLLLGAQPVTMSPMEWDGAIRIDLKRWERLVRQAQMVAE
ncbi:tripartite tricarboxylate transporter substrate binding protein [Rubrivivax sp. RP6-9]|uniref:tripartite tricarboxylate transporter substrate binding protein n=1 Tax=Rubrivivax sp. RP6-9 TaxID=3415750 RepID=UPI003CC5F38C